MPDREKVIKGLECCNKGERCRECPYAKTSYDPEQCIRGYLLFDALSLLKAQENLKQKMWNALYAEEDKLEKKFIGTEEHGDWFAVYRPWLQRGFEIAIKVIAEQDGR